MCGAPGAASIAAVHSPSENLGATTLGAGLVPSINNVNRRVISPRRRLLGLFKCRPTLSVSQRPLTNSRVTARSRWDSVSTRSFAMLWRATCSCWRSTPEQRSPISQNWTGRILTVLSSRRRDGQLTTRNRLSRQGLPNGNGGRSLNGTSGSDCAGVSSRFPTLSEAPVATTCWPRRRVNDHG